MVAKKSLRANRPSLEAPTLRPACSAASLARFRSRRQCPNSADSSASSKYWNQAGSASGLRRSYWVTAADSARSHALASPSRARARASIVWKWAVKVAVAIPVVPVLAACARPAASRNRPV